MEKMNYKSSSNMNKIIEHENFLLFSV